MNAVSTAVATMFVRAGQTGCTLRWSKVHACWRWLDPARSQLYAWAPSFTAPVAARLLEGASLMASCASGGMLLGVGKRLGMLELPVPGQAVRPLQTQVLVTIDAAEPRTGISDGCVDRAGNFVFGTANLARDQRPIGSFYQYSQRHGLRRLALPAVARAASIAFSLDGRRMYFADAAHGAILQCDYDAEQARIGAITTFAALLAPGAGMAVIDSVAQLWSVQGGLLVQYAGDGQPLRQIALPCEAVSSVAFGGEGLEQLRILGARGGLYGLPGASAAGVADTLFLDNGSASSTSACAQR